VRETTRECHSRHVNGSHLRREHNRLIRRHSSSA
jgi:hypothetical protein